MCHVLSCQFVLTPPILLSVYWLISPSCFPSLPSSFAPFKISLCLQFRVGALPCVGSSMSCAQPSLPVCQSASLPVCQSASLPVCQSASLPVCQSASLFFPYGIVFVCLSLLLKVLVFLLHLGPRLIHSPVPDKFLSKCQLHHGNESITTFVLPFAKWNVGPLKRNIFKMLRMSDIHQQQ